MGSITSANAVFMLSIGALYSSPQNITNFAADDIFDVDPMMASETMMGVDGKLSAGLVNAPVKWRVALMADSPSIPIFENWYETQRQIQDVYFATGVVALASINRTFNLSVGSLDTYPPIPNARRVLQPRIFSITWERIVPSRIAQGV